jgi:hypothetical protein
MAQWLPEVLPLVPDDRALDEAGHVRMLAWLVAR